MNRLTKWLYFSLLLAVALLQVFIGKVWLGLLLIALTVVGLWFFEKRELKRSFYRALRKLYVCADLDGFHQAAERMLKNALFRGWTVEANRLYKGISLYFEGDLDGARSELEQVHADDDFAYWQYLYLKKCDPHMPMPDLEVFERQVPSYFKEIADQSLSVYRAIYVDALEVKALDVFRETIDYNLLMAEVLNVMSEKATSPRMAQYYEKASSNLSKQLKLSSSGS